MTLPSLKIDIDSYPAIKSHLLSFGKDRLEQTGKTLADGGKSRKKTPHQWFELQDTCAYHAEFEREKIVYPNMTKFLPFTFEATGKFTNQKCFIITGGTHLKYLTAVLNSRVGMKWLLNNCPELQGGTRELSKVFFERIPIPQINADRQQIFVRLVDEILERKAEDKSASDLEAEIDRKVYEIYGLTNEEIKTVESA